MPGSKTFKIHSLETRVLLSSATTDLDVIMPLIYPLPDDHGDTPRDATQLPHGPDGGYEGRGMLENAGDRDVFAIRADQDGMAFIHAEAHPWDGPVILAEGVVIPEPITPGTRLAVFTADGEILAEIQLPGRGVIEPMDPAPGEPETDPGAPILPPNEAVFPVRADQVYFIGVEGGPLVGYGFFGTLSVKPPAEDDHGDTREEATRLEFNEENNIAGRGLINLPGDADVFAFTAPEWGTIIINGWAALPPDPDMPTLDPAASIVAYDSEGQFLGGIHLFQPLPIDSEAPEVYRQPLMFDAQPGRPYFLVVTGRQFANYEVFGHQELPPPDDYADTREEAFPVEVPVAPFEGFPIIVEGGIQRPGDVDMFSFTAGVSGTANIDLNVNQIYYIMDGDPGVEIMPPVPPPPPNTLQPRVAVFDADGRLIAEAAAPGDRAHVGFHVTEGQTYYIAAVGDRGSCGAYFVTGQVRETSDIEAHLVETIVVRGGAVKIYDMDDGPTDIRIAHKADGSYDALNSEVIVVPGLFNTVTAVILTGSFSNAGIVVEGNLGAIADLRADPGPISFIATRGDLHAALLRGPLEGSVLNGVELLPGMAVPPDPDGDGIADPTALLVGGNLNALVALGVDADGASIAGDVIVGGSIGYVYSAGDITGDVISHLRIGSIRSMRHIRGHVRCEGGNVGAVWAAGTIEGLISGVNVDLVYAGLELLAGVNAEDLIKTVVAGTDILGDLISTDGITFVGALRGHIHGRIIATSDDSVIGVVHAGGSFRGMIETRGRLGSLVAREIAPQGAERIRILAEGGIDRIAVRESVRDADIAVGMDGVQRWRGPAEIRNVFIGRDCARTNLLAGAHAGTFGEFPDGEAAPEWRVVESGRIGVVFVGGRMGEDGPERWGVGASAGFGIIVDSEGVVRVGLHYNVNFWQG
ncbi:MAG TPA: hypothetical protein PL033_06675 [Candidatus Brocadiia bacterium]|nr:hypothetical protein [Candidatus Brocadiia bacterium]